MKLCDKIIELRKINNMSQEALAEKLNVSRQAISRWEMGTAMPDAANILRLSKLFHVTTDYLLNDDYLSDDDLPRVKKVKNDNMGQIMIYLVTIEVMILVIQFMSVFILQNIVFAFFSFVPFVAAIGGFEYAFRKNDSSISEQTLAFRRKFYKISAWLGAYFPVRFIASVIIGLYPRPYSVLVKECIILAVYIACAFLLDLKVEENYIHWKSKL